MELTAHQEKVLDLLRKTKEPMTAYALLDALRDDGFRAPPTVYRALEGLMAKGLAHKIESQGAFVACTHPGEGDHAASLLLCNSCGAVAEVEDESLTASLAKIGRKFLAQIDHSVLEITGLCTACAAKRKGKK